MTSSASIITNWNAWSQPETYQFFLLQSVAVVLALIISIRDRDDRE
jgi:hypothetical protein